MRHKRYKYYNLRKTFSRNEIINHILRTFIRNERINRSVRFSIFNSKFKRLKLSILINKCVVQYNSRATYRVTRLSRFSFSEFCKEGNLTGFQKSS